jgi:hypothetical protein
MASDDENNSELFNIDNKRGLTSYEAKMVAKSIAIILQFPCPAESGNLSPDFLLIKSSPKDISDVTQVPDGEHQQ